MPRIVSKSLQFFFILFSIISLFIFLWVSVLSVTEKNKNFKYLKESMAKAEKLLKYVKMKTFPVKVNSSENLYCDQIFK